MTRPPNPQDRSERELKAEEYAQRRFAFSRSEAREVSFEAFTAGHDSRDEEVERLRGLICKACSGEQWVCENHPNEIAHTCTVCGGAGMPCLHCNPASREGEIWALRSRLALAEKCIRLSRRYAGFYSPSSGEGLTELDDALRAYDESSGNKNERNEK